MQSFEQQYYESDEFWKEGMVGDEANTRRLNKSVELVPQGTQTLADIGCGNGIFAVMLQKLRPELDTTSVDRSETALKYVKTKSKVGDITGLPFEDKTFDCVTCFQVLEHIPYPVYDTVLNELSRISKKHVIISVPYQEKTEDDITQCPACHTIFNAELHLRNYQDKDIQQLFTKFNFKCVKQQLIEKYNEQYLGVDSYIKFRNAHLKNKGKFRSPICPICGYENAEFKMVTEGEPVSVATAGGGGIKSLLKKFWPKVKLKNNWVIAVYERV
ncbi:MAG: class I SAM-dependent methyltransferase [Chitinophagaceae bacterium]|nr:class I SAM-dependent methyltransferase [Chitinophagaceae bacterium]